MRPGGLLRYVDGVSTSYVYFNGDDVVDYGALSANDFIELIYEHAEDKDNQIIWNYLMDRAELFMTLEELRQFRAWVLNRQIGLKHLRLKDVCKRHNVVMRKEPLER